MAKISEYMSKGLAAYKSGDYATAVRELEQATIEDPKDSQAFVYLGAAYTAVGRQDAAIGAFKRAEELSPEDARIHYNLGQAYESAGVVLEAYREYAKALKINPCYSQARMAFMSLRLRVGENQGRGMQRSA